MPGHNPGQFYAVHLEGIRAQKVTILEPSKRHEAAVFGTERIKRAIDERNRINQGRDGWKP